MALTADRDTPQRDGELIVYPVAAGAVLFAGALVALDSDGNAVPASASASLVVMGRAEETADNSDGAAGDEVVPLRRSVFRYTNSAATDQITLADVGRPAYVVDDQTVAKTSNGGVRPVAGIVLDVDTLGVWVACGVQGLAADPAHARELLKTNKVYIPVHVASLVGADATVYRFVSPVTGTITKLTSVLEIALTTGDATVTPSIGGVAITGGALTITQAGSAPGDVDSATPSAANTVTAGQAVALTVGGTNDANASAMILVEITF